METISFTKKSFKKFKAVYETVGEGEVFLFEGKEFLKEYAKYVIEYLENCFKPKGE